MSLVAVVGDCASTIVVGLTAGYPGGERAVAAELDPAGGVLAAWLDVPRSPGLSELVASGSAGSWPAIEEVLQTSPSGLEVLVSPVRAVEAAASIASCGPMLSVVSALDSVTVIADGGRMRGGLSPLVVQAGLVVVGFRQHPGSPAAAAVGVDRLAETCGLLSVRSIPFVVALIGDRPYSAGEIADHVGAEMWVELPVDEWAALVFAGRAATKRMLARSKLSRATAELAGMVSVRLRQLRTDVGWDPGWLADGTSVEPPAEGSLGGAG